MPNAFSNRTATQRTRTPATTTAVGETPTLSQGISTYDNHFAHANTNFMKR